MGSRYTRKQLAPLGFARLPGNTDRTEPICWSWRPPDEDDIQEARFDTWAPAEGYDFGSWNHALNVLMNFCRGRCTICGDGDQGRRVLHMDHDHKTRWCRGVLCPSCNQREGYGGGILFANYRQRPPAAIAGVRVEWQQGLGPWPMPELSKFWRDLELFYPDSPGWRSREGRTWIVPEVALLRRDDLSDSELAGMLGRSLAAVTRKRKSIGAAFWLPPLAAAPAA
jgi:hypothetical protein